jgi:hypothetical protein
MKKEFFALILFCTSFTAFSKDRPGALLKKAEDLSLMHRKVLSTEENSGLHGAIKLNIFPLLLKNISLQAEIGINKNASGCLGFSIIGQRNIPGFLTPSIFTNAKLSGWSITPEFRWYPGEGQDGQPPQGFYIAPYFRYSKYTLTGDFNYDYSNLIIIRANVKGTYSGKGIGAMLGYQWVVNNHFSIDWWIAGGHVGSGKVEVAVTDPIIGTLLDYDKTLLISYLLLNYSGEAINIPGNTITLEHGAPYLGFRTGLCVGFSF